MKILKKAVCVGICATMYSTSIGVMAVSEPDNRVYLRDGFVAPDNEYRPVPFYHMDGDISQYDVVYDEIRNNRRMGYGGMAILPVSETLPKGYSEEYYDALHNLLNQLDELNMTAIYYDDVDFPSGHAAGKLLAQYPDSEGKELNKYEFLNQTGSFNQTITLNSIQKEIIVSAVAVGEDNTIVNMAEGVNGANVSFNLPEGSYSVYIFTCKTYSFHKRLDFLNYNYSQNFVKLSYDEMIKRFPEHMGYTVKMTFYDDIRYWAANGRSWQYDMKEQFEAEYGIDPTPYYPALVTDIGEDTMWFRAAFMSLRAKLYSNGFFKAVGDWGEKNNIITTGHIAGPGMIDATNTSGDLMLIQKNVGAAGQDAIHGYMHSLNAFKITSSSANNFDKEIAMSEIYGNYPENSGMPILYSEAMHAFSRGINYLIPHGIWYKDAARIPPQLSYKSPIYGEGLQDYTTFVARCQYLLRGSKHACDIGLLYPIRSLEAQSTLGFYASAFDVNPAPQNADYMNIINSVLSYSNKDLTVLHPETINERITVSNDSLKLNNEVNSESYKVFIMPSSVMVELSNLKKIESFYDNGGKVIATGVLPYKSYEKGMDDEVIAIIEKMFGAPTQYSVKTNQNGGKTYFIPHTQDLLGGCKTVDNEVLYQALNDALAVYDVEFADKLAIDNHGYFNYIHKVKDGVDIYFFGNASNTVVDTYVDIRGKIVPEIWNPMDGSMNMAEYEYISENGIDKTRIKLNVNKIEGLFIVDASKIKNNTVLFKDDFNGSTIKWNNPQVINDGMLSVSSLTSAIGTRGLCDFTLMAEADLTQNADIVFRMLDEGDNYRWSFNNNNGNVSLVAKSLKNYNEVQLESVNTSILATANAKIKIVCIGDEITSYINDVQISEIKDKTNRFGEFGFKTGVFSDVSVSLPPSTKQTLLVNDDFDIQSDKWENTQNTYVEPSVRVSEGTKFRVKIDVSGSTIKTYVNNCLANTITDATHAVGGIGFRESATENSTFDNVIVKKSEQVIFSDDFAGDLSKWDNTQNVSIVDGSLKVTGTESIIAKNSTAWDNYTLETDVLIGNYAGITFRATNSNNYYMWQLSFSGGKLWLKAHKKVNGGYSIICENSIGDLGGYLHLLEGSSPMIKNSQSWGDYLINTDIEIENSPINIDFRKSINGAYRWELGIAGTNVYVKPTKNGVLMANAITTTVTNKKFNLKIDAKSGFIKTYVNDQLVLSLIDDTYLTGSVGFFADSNQSGYVHNFSVKSISTNIIDFGENTDVAKEFELPPVVIRPNPVTKLKLLITFNGEALTDDIIYGTGLLEVQANVESYFGDGPLLIICKYSAEGKLIDVLTKPGEFNENGVITQSLAIGKDDIGKNLKIMVWDGFTHIQSLTTVVEKSILDKPAVVLNLIDRADFSSSNYNSTYWSLNASGSGSTYIDGKLRLCTTTGGGWGGFLTKNVLNTPYKLAGKISTYFYTGATASGSTAICVRKLAGQSNSGLSTAPNFYNQTAVVGQGGKGAVYFTMSYFNNLNPADGKIRVMLVNNTDFTKEEYVVSLPNEVRLTNETAFEVWDTGNEITLTLGGNRIVTIDTVNKQLIYADDTKDAYTVNLNATGEAGMGGHVQAVYLDDISLYGVL